MTAGSGVTIDDPRFASGPWIDPTSADYGATGDGTTNDAAAIQEALDAIDADGGGRMFIPDGTYNVATTTLDIPSNIVIQFQSPNAIIKYTGSGSAMKISDEKHIAILSGKIDISGASSGAIGLHVAGCWFLDVVQPTVKQTAGTIGIQIETSGTNGGDFGAYVITIRQPNLGADQGSGAKGIETKRTTSDSVNVTHLLIENGWIKNKGYGLYLDRVSSFWVVGTAFEADSGETTNDAIFCQNCTEGCLMPGEMTGFDGYGLNFGSGNGSVSVLFPGGFNSLGTGSINRATYSPPGLQRDEVRLFGSATDQTYSVLMQSIFASGNPFRLIVNGGVTARTLFEWSEAGGLKIEPVANIDLLSAGGSTGYKFNGTKVVGAQGAAVADAAGGATVDAEARTALNALLARLRTHGLIAT